MKLNAKERAAVSGWIVNPLPAPARGRLLLDKAFSSKLGLAVKSWFPLGDVAQVETASLHNALRAAFAKRKSAIVELRDGSRLRVKTGLGKAGEATLQVKKGKFAFADAGLLSADKRTRTKAVRRVLAEKPLSTHEEDRWLKIATERPLRNDEYVELMMALGGTPEAVRAARSKPQDVNSEKLMPDEPAYYGRLVGQLVQSTSLSAYVSNELAVGRRALFERHPKSALRRIGFTALWQALIPFELLSAVSAADLAPLLEAEDPFSLLFGFEICCRMPVADKAVVELGASFLRKLLLEPEKSLARCEIFCACALISVTCLRGAAKASNAPLFWVRLAALAHAGVLTDALRGLPDPHGFLRWATRGWLANYLWHGVIDRRDAPRWNPEWISPDQLYAELAGRAHGALQMMPESTRPGPWVAAMDAVLKQLKSSGREVTASFPAPFDDFNEVPIISSRIPAFKEIEEELAKASSLGDVPELAILADASQPSEGVVQNVLRLLSGPVDKSFGARELELPLLGVCAHIAAMARNKQIADIVINRCLFRLQQKDRSEPATDLFMVAIHACAAQAGAEEHRKFLETTAVKCVFALDTPDDLSKFDVIFEVLGIRDEKLIPAVARARAVIRTKLAQG